MNDYLTTSELAFRWKLHPGTLRTWRMEGRGPAYFKIGRKCLYRIQVVEEYESRWSSKSKAKKRKRRAGS